MYVYQYTRIIRHNRVLLLPYVYVRVYVPGSREGKLVKTTAAKHTPGTGKPYRTFPGFF